MKDTDCKLPTVNYQFPIPNFSNAGFTLLEVMIALAIIGIALTTVLYTVNYQANVAYEGTVTTHMYMLAKERISEMERDPKNSSGTIPGTEIRYRDTVKSIDDADLIEIKTELTGHEKKIVLSELITKKAGL